MSTNKKLNNISNPALRLLNKPTQEDTQFNKLEHAQYSTQEDTLEQISLERPDYIKTQGRKGYKKPRINLAFDSDKLLSEIRMQAIKEGKSITQLVNESCVLYLNSIKKNKR